MSEEADSLAVEALIVVNSFHPLADLAVGSSEGKSATVLLRDA
jgi:hypothetical protein